MKPIDLTQEERCQDYLAIHMESSNDSFADRDSGASNSSKKSKNPFKKLGTLFKKKGIEDPDSDFFAKMEELKKECYIEGARKTITIKDTGVNNKKSISMNDF